MRRENNLLLEQFRSFYFRNYPSDMETLIEYFSIFGGLGIDIDTTKPIIKLIEQHILDNFDILNEKILDLTLNSKENQRLLRAFAIGDRRIFSAFNRAGLNNGNGGSALNSLAQKGILSVEYSREKASTKKTPTKGKTAKKSKA